MSVHSLVFGEANTSQPKLPRSEKDLSKTIDPLSSNNNLPRKPPLV
jgi:hypothetical protein